RYVHCRPRGCHQRGADQDWFGESHRSRGEVQSVTSHRGRAGPLRALPRLCCFQQRRRSSIEAIKQGRIQEVNRYMRDLNSLGWSEFFEHPFQTFIQSRPDAQSYSPGRVVMEQRGAYKLYTETEELTAS